MKKRQVRAKGVRIWDGQSTNECIFVAIILQRVQSAVPEKVPEEHLRNNILWSDGTKIEHSGHHLCLEETRNHPFPAQFHPYSEVATK